MSECATCPVTNNHGTSKVKSLFTEKRAVCSPVNFVGCSVWITGAAKKSALLHNAAVTAIPNPINVDVFKPVNKNAARKLFNLPVNKKLILFTAVKLSDIQKGMHYFIEACRRLATLETTQQTAIVLLGGKMDAHLLSAIPFETCALGYLKTSADIAAAYAACDVFVTPSLEENLPNTIMEAMACGTPCVGFNAGGIPEMIDHKETGYVAAYKNVEDLAAGIAWCMENHAALSAEARLKVMNNYTEERVAKQYIELYQHILNRN